MSSPQNPLASYRSYSYYHVLVLCDSTQTAEALSRETSLEVWQHARPGTTNSELGPMAPKSIDGAGKYCVLINGSTDAAFSITTATWTTATAASAVKDDRNTSIVIEGSLAVSEPKGIVFLDRVVRACIELGVDSANAVWCLKTFFVGYSVDDGGNEDHSHITDIDPLLFIAIDVAGSFTEQGGFYEISFVSTAHGQARLPQFSKSGRAANFKVGKNLKETFANLTNVVNSNYEHYYKCVHDQLAAVDPNNEISNTLRKVTYVIEASPPYDQDRYTVTDQPAQAKSGGGCDDPVTARIDANSSIETGIHSIMAMCSEVKKEMGEGIDGEKYQYQIHSAVESKTDNETGKIDFYVIYRVKQIRLAHSLSLESFAGPAGSPIDDTLKDNIVEFEYLYTGKNIDILEFDMKLSMGLAYLQIASSTNSYRGSFGEASSNTVTSSKDLASGVTMRNNVPTQNVPVYFGSLIKAPNSRDTNDSASTTQSSYNMAKHSSIEMIDTSMKIVGNPLLLSSVNRNSAPSQVKKDGVTEKQTDHDVYPGWGTVPSIAKIHIKMPKNNDDLFLFSGGRESSTSGDTGAGQGIDYAVDFWFQGYYYIIGIVHTFDSGEFTQKLEMLSIPEKNAFALEGDTQKKLTADLTKEIRSCYDSTFPCVDSQNRAPLAIPENRWGASTTPGSVTIDRILNPSVPSVLDGTVMGQQGDLSLQPQREGPFKNDEVSDFLHSQSIPAPDAAVVSNGVSPSTIKGWDTASPEVKQAMERAAKEEGVDLTTMVQFASVESSFNTNAVSSTGCTGLFQFAGGTWKDMGMEGISRTDPYANSVAGARYIKQNQKGLKKTLGRDPTVGEIYLAHNQGLGGARQIIKACETGDDRHISAKVRSNMSKQFAGAGRMSGCEFRNWAETFVAKKSTTGIPHVPHITQTSSSTSQPTTGRPIRANKDAVAASRDCNVENKITTDETKRECVKQPISQDEKNSPSTSGRAEKPLSSRTDDVPRISKDGKVSMVGEKK